MFETSVGLILRYERNESSNLYHQY